MKRWQILLIVLAAFSAGLWVGQRSWTEPPQTRAKPLAYQDSMHPWVKSDQPGICPICGMELTPIFEGEPRPGDSPALVTLSPEAVTVADVASEPVLRRDVHRTIRVSGTFEAQESRTAIVAAPAGGRVESIAVDHAGMEIQQGETLVRIFSPDLAQRSRFLRIAMSNQTATSVSASKAAQSPGHAATAATGMTNENAAPVIGGYRLDLFMSDLTAPISGIVSERLVTLGEYVMEGQKIATMMDPSVLWFRFDATDRQLSWILPGQRINIQTESAPGKAWGGTVSFVEPVYDESQRLGKVRAVVTNTPADVTFGLRSTLLPGMLGEGVIKVILPNVLVVPKSAVIYPGSSAWVYVEHESRAYERRRIRLGREGDDWWEVLEGVMEGERVVTTGNVLIDAQATFETGAIEPAGSAGEEVMPDPEDARDGTHPSFSPSDTFSAPFTEALNRFITASDQMAAALGHDNLTEYNRALPRLAETTASLQQAGNSPRWITLISAITEVIPKLPAQSIKEARAAFLDFGAAAAELAQHARTLNANAGSFHIYHCPMAPKPGLWIQAGAQIVNPFFGETMLRCGEEIDARIAIGSLRQPD